MCHKTSPWRAERGKTTLDHAAPAGSWEPPGRPRRAVKGTEGEPQAIPLQHRRAPAHALKQAASEAQPHEPNYECGPTGPLLQILPTIPHPFQVAHPRGPSSRSRYSTKAGNPSSPRPDQSAFSCIRARSRDQIRWSGGSSTPHRSCNPATGVTPGINRALRLHQQERHERSLP